MNNPWLRLWQAIIWTNDALIYWRMYTSLGFSEVKLRLDMSICVFAFSFTHGPFVYIHASVIYELSDTLWVRGSVGVTYIIITYANKVAS